MGSKAKSPPEAAHSGRGDYEVKRVEYYAASTTWWEPSKGWPGAATEHRVTCGHRHGTPEAAARCGQVKAARQVAAFNARARAEYPQRACDRQVYREERMYEPEGSESRQYTEPGFLVYCASHHTHGGTMHRTAEGAARQDWECPWAPFVTVQAKAAREWDQALSVATAVLAAGEA